MSVMRANTVRAGSGGGSDVVSGNVRSVGSNGGRFNGMEAAARVRDAMHRAC